MIHPEPAGDIHGVCALRVRGVGVVRMGHTEPWVYIDAKTGERSTIPWSILASYIDEGQLSPVYPTTEVDL